MRQFTLWTLIAVVVYLSHRKTETDLVLLLPQANNCHVDIQAERRDWRMGIRAGGVS